MIQIDTKFNNIWKCFSFFVPFNQGIQWLGNCRDYDFTIPCTSIWFRYYHYYHYSSYCYIHLKIATRCGGAHFFLFLSPSNKSDRGHLPRSRRMPGGMSCLTVWGSSPRASANGCQLDLHLPTKLSCDTLSSVQEEIQEERSRKYILCRHL